MTTTDILSSVSEILAQDERILSASERELLASLLQHAGRNHAARPELADAIRETIDRAVGEIVTQRAFGIVGNRVLQQLLGGRTTSGWRLGTPPTAPPSPGDSPRVPGPSQVPPGQTPSGISAHARLRRENDCHGIAVPERAALMPAQAFVLDEFLAPQELSDLVGYTLMHESDFQVSEVIAPGVDASRADFSTRRSLVLMELEKHREVMVSRIQACLPQVLQKLGMEPFAVSDYEAQITASNHGDFFRPHTDNGHTQTAPRELTFVYFFHREPKAFRGGELRVYESRWEDGRYNATANYRSIVPEQNQIVFFPSSLVHEITPVECSTATFADSRFTVNGWLHR